MPIHDWTRVTAGTFHHLHTSWIVELARVLNDGLLPPEVYALAEQQAGDIGPDVLALSQPSAEHPSTAGMTAVAEAPPAVSVKARADEAAWSASRARQLAIRHATGDQVVALIEILSPGNKDREKAVQRFVDKAVESLRAGVHLLLVDLHPPGRHDRAGIHGAVWADFSGTPYVPPAGRPLTLAGYCAAALPEAYVEPCAVGDVMPEMPLFLEEGWYVPVPLEATYMAAYATVPARWRGVIEGTA